MIELITFILILIVPVFIIYKKRKLKPLTNLNTDKDTDSDISNFKKEYKKINSDISYVESKFNKYVITSLESDMETFKNWLYNNFEQVRQTSIDSKFWIICGLESHKFGMHIGNRHSGLTIFVTYEWYENEVNVKITDIRSNSIKLFENDQKLKEIISKYFLLVKMASKKSESIKLNNQLGKAIDIIGKETIRDERIDELLKNI